MNVAEYLGDTKSLSQGEHGAYWLLICEYWQRGPIPNDKERIYRITNAMDMQSKCNADNVLSHFFLLNEGEGDQWTHKRIEDELSKAEVAHKKRKDASNRRWRTPERLMQMQSRCNAYPLDIQSQSQSHIKPKPTDEMQSISNAYAKDVPRGTFDRFSPLEVSIAKLQERGLAPRDLGEPMKNAIVWVCAKRNTTEYEKVFDELMALWDKYRALKKEYAGSFKSFLGEGKYQDMLPDAKKHDPTKPPDALTIVEEQKRGIYRRDPSIVLLEDTLRK